MGKCHAVSYASSMSLGAYNFCCILLYDSYMACPMCARACVSFYRWNLQIYDRNLEIRTETVSHL